MYSLISFSVFPQSSASPISFHISVGFIPIHPISTTFHPSSAKSLPIAVTSAVLPVPGGPDTYMPTSLSASDAPTYALIADFSSCLPIMVSSTDAPAVKLVDNRRKDLSCLYGFAGAFSVSASLVSKISTPKTSGAAATSSGGVDGGGVGSMAMLRVTGRFLGRRAAWPDLSLTESLSKGEASKEDA